MRTSAFLLLFSGFLPHPVLSQTAATPAQVSSYGKLPLSFEANQGQADSQVRFTARGDGYALALTDKGAALSLSEPVTRKGEAAKADVVTMELVGAKPGVLVEGAERLPGNANYLIGNDPAKWHTDVSTYSRVKYSGVYPGVDLMYYGNQGKLEYDLIVAPGANPDVIQMKVRGSKELRLNKAGDLVIGLHGREISFEKPVIYQQVEGHRKEVHGNFVLDANSEVRFKVDTYDRTRQLVIDPTLSYSTYFGYGPSVTAMVVDSAGEACVTGSVYGTLPPTPGAYEYIKTSNYSTAYVSCLNATGTQLAYSTYLGGTGGDFATSMAVDASGNVYVGGYTTSIDFPQGTASYTSKKPSSSSYSSGFVAKVGSRGTTLLWASYLGGTASDKISALAVDGSGQVFVTGTTNSKDFPTKNAPEPTYKQYNNTGFASAFSTSGATLLYSTYLSGSNLDSPNAIAVDTSSNAYVAGSTQSSDFPTAGSPYQKTKATSSQAVFVTKIPVTGNSFTYSTFLSGTSAATAYALAVDSAGDVIVGGSTNGPDFPVSPTAFQKTNNTYVNSQSTGFVAELNPSGSKLLYATYLGGESSNDQVSALAVDGSGKAYVTGRAYSTKFPVTSDALYPTKRQASNYIGFLTILSADASSEVYSTYYGGSSSDGPNSIYLDATGSVYIAGYTTSSDYPVSQGAYEYTVYPTNGGSSSQAFITKFGATAASAATPTFTPIAGTYTSAQSVMISDTTPNSTIYYTTNGSTPTTSSATYSTPINVATTETISAIAVASGYGTSTTGTALYTINLPVTAATPVFTPGPGTYSAAQTIAISDSTPNATVYYTTNGTTPTANSTKYTAVISVATTQTIQAIAIATGYANSAVAVGAYTISVSAATPVISPTTGTYASAQTVTITDTTANATIYYTADGTVPTVSSTKYTGAITVSSTATISALAVASGLSNSAVATATLTITVSPVAATPSFSPAGGTYSAAQTVTITATTPGVTIYYTTNGSTPTASSTKYTAPVAVAATETVSAIAIATGYTNSAVATATYTITPLTPDFTLVLSTSSLSISKGGSGTLTATVTPQNGFSQSTTLACSGLPASTSCSFSPSAFTPNGAAVADQVTITSTAMVQTHPFLFLGGGGVVFALCLLAPLGSRRKRFMPRLMFAAVPLLSLLGLSGCSKSTASSGGSSSSPTTSVVIVTASGGGLSHTTTFTLTVQ